MSLTTLLMSFLFVSQLHAMNLTPNTESLPNLAGCADSDLTCDFSDPEIREALGLNASEPLPLQHLIHDPAYPDVVDQWADEELEGGHELEPGEEVALEELEEDADQPDAQVIEAGGKGGMPRDRAPIWGSFIGNFKKCAPGCVPARFGTYGKRGNKSCHPSGRAVDVGAIVCGGKTFTALGGGRFATFVGCMRGKMKTLYRNGKGVTAGHHDHAHFSNGCKTKGGTTY